MCIKDSAYTFKQIIKIFWFVQWIVGRLIPIRQIMSEVNKYLRPIIGFYLCDTSANLVNAAMDSNVHRVCFYFI